MFIRRIAKFGTEYKNGWLLIFTPFVMQSLTNYIGNERHIAYHVCSRSSDCALTAFTVINLHTLEATQAENSYVATITLVSVRYFSKMLTSFVDLSDVLV